MNYEALASKELALVQRGLKALGLYAGEIDGLRGPKTLSAWQAYFEPPAPDAGVIDARTSKHLQTLSAAARTKFAPFIRAARAKAAELGCEYVGIAGHRTYAEQDALYAKGRTAPGPIVTKARGGFSNHNFGIAMDFGVFQHGVYLDGGTAEQQRRAAAVHLACGRLAEQFGLEWGGVWASFPDAPHYEVKTGLSMAQKRERVARGLPVI